MITKNYVYINSHSLLFRPKHEAKHKGEYTNDKEKNEEANPAALSI